MSMQRGRSCNATRHATGPVMQRGHRCWGSVLAAAGLFLQWGLSWPPWDPPWATGLLVLGGLRWLCRASPAAGPGGTTGAVASPRCSPALAPQWDGAGLGGSARGPPMPLRACPLPHGPVTNPRPKNTALLTDSPLSPPWLLMGGLDAAPAAPLPTALPLPPKAGGDRGHGDPPPPPRVAMPRQDPRPGAVALGVPDTAAGGGLGTPLMPRLPSGQVWREAHGTRTPGPPLRQTPAPQPLTPRGPPRPAPGSPSR